MSCSFCHGHSRTPGRMTREQFGQILQRLQGKTNHIYYHLMGEPLSHPQLPEFIGMAREQGFRSIITTNGTLLARRGQELIQAGPHKVSISLHSFEGELGGTAGQDEAAYEKYMTQVRLCRSGFSGRDHRCLASMESGP